MKTTVSYTFDHEDSPEQIQAAVKAFELQGAVWEYAKWLRSNDKYGDGTPVDFATIREHFWNFMNEAKVADIID